MNREEKSLGRLGKMMFGIHGSICVACGNRPVTEWRTYIHIQNSNFIPVHPVSPSTTKHREGFAIVCQPSKVTEDKEHICLQSFPVLTQGWPRALTCQCVHTETSPGFPIPAFPGTRWNPPWGSCKDPLFLQPLQGCWDREGLGRYRSCQVTLRAGCGAIVVCKLCQASRVMFAVWLTKGLKQN